MQAQRGRAGISRVLRQKKFCTRSLGIHLKEILIKIIEYYLQKTQMFIKKHNTHP
jgi:hypothetical protein